MQDKRLERQLEWNKKEEAKVDLLNKVKEKKIKIEDVVNFLVKYL